MDLITVIICYYHYLFWAQIVPSLASGNPFKLASVSFWQVPIILLAFPFFLAENDVPGSYCAFFCQLLESALVHFTGEWFLEIRPGYQVCSWYWGSLLPSPLMDRAGREWMYVCVYRNMYVYMYYVYMYK